MQEDEEWPVLRDEIRRCFSDNKTPVHAVSLQEHFPVHGLNQNLRAFLYQCTKLHKMATNIQTRHDYDLRQKLHFLKRLKNTRIAKKWREVQNSRTITTSPWRCVLKGP